MAVGPAGVYRPDMRAAVVPAVALLVAAAAAASDDAAARRCATVERLQAVRDGRAAAPTWGVTPRPRSAGFVDSATRPIRVHWEDADAGQEPVAQALLGHLEDAWTEQVDAQGWPAPLLDDGAGGSTAYDAYVGFVGGAGALTVAGADASPDDDRHASPVWLHVSATLASDQLPVYAHHEFAHAVQFATDASESVMWFESSAVFQEVKAVPSSTSWTEPLPSFQQYPFFPLTTQGAAVAGFDDVPPADLYEYGAVLFTLYLEEVHGARDGTTLRAVWEAGVQDDDELANEPDWVDVLPSVVDEDVADVLLDFATWRALVGQDAVDGQGPLGAASLAGAEVRARGVNASRLDGQALVFDGDLGTYEGGCSVAKLVVDEAMPVRATARALRDGRRVGMATAVLVDGDADRDAHGGDDDEVVAELDLPAGATLFVATCDVTIDDADEAPEESATELRLLRTDVDFPDEDAGVVPAEDAGVVVVPPDPCGCQSTAPGRGPAWGALLIPLAGVFMFAVRAWRHRKRQRLYKRPTDASAESPKTR